MSRRLCDICHARPAISLLTLRRRELHREIEVCEFHPAGTAASKEKATMNEASAKLRPQSFEQLPRQQIDRIRWRAPAEA
jgi:hypothetical protein